MPILNSFYKKSLKNCHVISRLSVFILSKSKIMKIVIIGGTGRIGSKLTAILEQQGHTVIAASPSTGVNTISGEGLDEALSNAQVLVDVSNVPGADAQAALEFFETSTRNLVAAEKKNKVTHHVVLSIVGVDRMQSKGYFSAKQAQEKLVKNSGIPYTIVQATQFFEFLNDIAASGVKGDTILLPAVSFQPIAVDDVAAILASVATGEPVNGTIAIAGPEKGTMAAIVGKYLKNAGDTRVVLPDANAGYFGVELSDESLVPLEGSNQRIGKTDLGTWLQRQQRG
jgi:uncharacterized protein YbjT (DUF2867 family)